MEKDFTFRMRRIFQQVALEYGISPDPNRLAAMKIEQEDRAGKIIIRAMLGIATQEEEVFEFADNWMTRLGQWWWKKQKKLRARYHKLPAPKVIKVWAVHKFPDVNVPLNLIGSEYVHFRLERIVE